MSEEITNQNEPKTENLENEDVLEKDFNDFDEDGNLIESNTEKDNGEGKDKDSENANERKEAPQVEEEQNDTEDSISDAEKEAAELGKKAIEEASKAENEDVSHKENKEEKKEKETKVKEEPFDAFEIAEKEMKDDPALDKIKQLKADLPDVADAINALLKVALKNERAKSIQHNESSSLSSGEEQARQSHETLVNEVSKVHPDCREIMRDKNFQDWYSKQCKEIQALGYSPVVEHGVALFTAYKAYQKRVDAKNDVEKANQEKLKNHKSNTNNNVSPTDKKQTFTKHDMNDAEAGWDDVKEDEL